MARKRYISTEMGFDDRLRKLSQEQGAFAVLLYTWMIPHAEDDGTIKGSAEVVMARVIPTWRWVDASEVEGALVAMRALGLIQWDGEQVVFPSEKFYAYQTYIKPGRRRIEKPKDLPRTSENFLENPGDSEKVLATHSHSHLHPHLQSHPHSVSVDTLAAELAFQIGTTNSVQIDAIADHLREGVEEDAIRSAIQMTREKGKRFDYLLGVLKRWREDGIKTIAQVEQERANFKASKAQKEATPSVKPGVMQSPPEDEDAFYDRITIKAR